MENNREHLYLAALLHDIGKFYQRADTGSVTTSRFLSEINKVEGVFLPSRSGVYSHKHCLWTAQFIDDHKSVFKNLIGDNFLDLSDNNNLYSLAARHHLKKEQLSDLGQIIKEADGLSSGMDRETELAFKDEQDESGWDAFKKIRMTSVLETIPAGQYAIKYHLPVSAISLSKDYFPKKQFTESPDYEKLWNDFVKDFQCISANDYKAFCESLLTLLCKYTSCIPASTIHFPDVSLYDHLKTTAALSICLYDYKGSKPTRSTKNDPPFLLIGANISGIQSYIYQIISKYAGKNLKGRSFFLRILTDAIVRYLIQKLGLFQSNVVYNSGGGFYIIAPNTSSIQKTLQKAIQAIEKKIFDSFGIALFVAIDAIPVSKDDLMHKDNAHHLGIIWHNLNTKLEKKKSSKCAELIENGYDQFFEPLLHGGDALHDRITGEELLPDENRMYMEGDYLLKENTFIQIELGKRLRETAYMIVSDHELTYWPDPFHVNPAGLGFYYYFVREGDFTQSVDHVSIIRFNNPDFIFPADGNNLMFEFQYYGGNEYDEQTFETMTEKVDFQRLGVLRMDVDNLGLIFRSGIPPGRATLSRFAALSRSLDYFFSGYLNTIWKEIDQKHALIIYSGGDDVFIVGRWDVVIAFAKKIRDDFREFTCCNPSFSISGGIAIVPEKYPIMKGAEESGKEEKAAKNHTVYGISKNSISLMDFPMNWETEFPAIETLKDELVRLIDKENAPKSLFSKIMAHATNAGIKAHRITNLKTYWMLTYDLSRMKERAKPGLKQLINNCITEVCGNKPQLNGLPIETEYHALELWAFAARWAEICTGEPLRSPNPKPRKGDIIIGVRSQESGIRNQESGCRGDVWSPNPEGVT